jgi:hypothetical protein
MDALRFSAISPNRRNPQRYDCPDCGAKNAFVRLPKGARVWGCEVKLITLQAPGGGSICVCRACDQLMDAGRLVIRDHRGRQYCQTERGLTEIAGAHCDACAMIRDGSATVLPCERGEK